MLPGMPNIPALNLSTTAASHSGDIGAPNTVYFGSFGGGSFDLLAMAKQYWPMLAVAAVAVLLIRRK
jgi:hypothetical protein